MVESEGSHRPFSHSLIIFLDRAGSSFDPSAAIVNGAAWRAARILLLSICRPSQTKARRRSCSNSARDQTDTLAGMSCISFLNRNEVSVIN